MPKRDIETIRANLYTLCTECGYKIEPNEIQRIDGERLWCPKCGQAFIPSSHTRN